MQCEMQLMTEKKWMQCEMQLMTEKMDAVWNAINDWVVWLRLFTKHAKLLKEMDAVWNAINDCVD